MGQTYQRGPPSLITNTLVQLIPPATRMALGLALTATLGRYLGVRGFGTYALVFAYVAIVGGIFNDWGLATVCLREIAQRPAKRARLIASAATLQGAIALGSYALMLASLVVVRYPASVRVGIAIYGLSVLLAPLDILALSFTADLRLVRLLSPSLVGVGLNFVLSMVVIAAHGPLAALVAASLASLLVQYAWIGLLSLKALQVRVRPTTVGWAPFMRDAWPLGSAAIASTVLQQAPMLALSLVSLDAVGLFSAANRIPQQLLILPFAIRTTTFPLLSAAWTADRARFRRLLEGLIAGSLIVVVPAVILGILVAGPLMSLLFGPGFQRSAVPFALLLGVSGVMFPGILAGEALVAAGYQRLNLAVLSASLPLLLVLLAVLVPEARATGAAAAALATYAVIAAATLRLARVKLGLWMPGSPMVMSARLRTLWSLKPFAAGDKP